MLCSSLLDFLCYPLRLWRSKGHGVHSPFAFSLITSTLRIKERYYAYDEIEAMAVARNLKHEMKLVVRLLARFNPASIRLCGVDDFMATLVATQCPSAMIVADPEDDTECDFTIVYNPAMLPRKVKDRKLSPDSSVVTLYTDLKQKEQMKAWTMVCNSHGFMTFKGCRSAIAVKRHGLPAQSFKLLF